MKLSEESKKVFLLEIHEIINRNVSFTLDKFKKGSSLACFVLTDEEEEYIESNKSSPLLHSIIEKIITRNLDDAFFSLMGLLDGLTNPNPKFGEWNNVLLVDMPIDYDGDSTLLNEVFFSAFDEWKKIKGK